ncbi:DNA-processing protein DprA [Candidatus Poribacteria bacterium]|nr:DNA-processing protein DprA [Candidatus Poribacteria bacterium]
MPETMDDIDRIALASIEGLNARRFQALEQRFDSAGDVLRARDIDIVAASPRLSARMAQRIAARHGDLTMVERQVEALRRAGVAPVFCGEAAYPSALESLRDAPPVLFVQGNLPSDERRCLAVVGTREPDDDGRSIAEWAASRAVEAGWIVVSGLARGIDAAAHRGALASTPYQATVAFVGNGPLSLYPPEHGSLAAAIREQGAVVSERLWGSARARWLVRRNRLISGMSSHVLLVQSGTTDGAMHTVRFAGQQRRSVGVWDWGPNGNLAEGPRALCDSGSATPLTKRTFDEWLLASYVRNDVPRLLYERAVDDPTPDVVDEPLGRS